MQAASALTLYPPIGDSATPGLRDVLCKMIEASGPLPFPAFMEQALYHPEFGYYAQAPLQIGRTGDFFTSVSVGPLFGYLLCLRAVRWWTDAGKPTRWRWIEIGAHNGTLAADVLDALPRISPDAACGVRYTIIEPIASLRRHQNETLASFGDLISINQDSGEISDHPLPTFFVANEVLDALPFHIIRRENGEWYERCVSLEPSGSFAWASTAITPGPLAGALSLLPSGLCDGYQTELRTGLRDFLSRYLKTMTHGIMVWIDYGFAADELYLPGRSGGTSRTFHKHHAGSCPLTFPGQVDITAHVDFTAFAMNAMALKAEPVCFQSQGVWLVHTAEPWLRSLEGTVNTSLVRQFQTLTHPAHLGSRFQVLELAWNEDVNTATSQETRMRLGIS